MMNKHLLVILAVSILVFFANIWGPSIYILDEAKNATCAREMMDSGDLIVPTFNGHLRVDKPPLHYYFMIFGYQLFGVNPFGARFFSALFGVFTILITFWFSNRLLGKQTAIYTSLVLLSSLQVSIQFHLAVPDPYLIFFITSSLFTFFIGIKERAKKFILLFYIFSALGFLTKGPVAFVLPGLSLLIFLLMTKSFNTEVIRLLIPWEGILLLLLISVPWYLLVGLATQGEWLEGFFFKHNLNRYAKTMEGHGGGYYKVFLFVISGLLPFSIYIFQSGIYAWKNRQNRVLLFCLIVVIVFVGFFSTSHTVLPSYPSPSYPFIAVLIGFFIHDVLKRNTQHRHKLGVGLGLILLLCVLIPVAIYFVIGQDLSISHLAGMAWGFVLMPLGALATFILYQRGKGNWGFYVLSGTFAVTSVIFSYWIFPRVDNENPVKGAMKLISTEGKAIAGFKRMNPSFVFYFKKTVPKFNTVDGLERFLSQHEEAYVVSSKDNMPDTLLDSLGLETVYEQKDLFEKPVTVLLQKKSQNTRTPVSIR